MMIDPNTGFPRAKDDQFWRVSRAESLRNRFEPEEYVRVELVDKVTGDTMGVRAIKERDVTKEFLLAYAEDILTEIRNKEGVESLLGCYPPNKL